MTTGWCLPCSSPAAGSPEAPPPQTRPSSAARKDAGPTGRGLAALAGRHSSKVSKIEFGRQAPSEDDIRAWCHHTGNDPQIPDLVATVRHVESMYVEWRRMLGTGTRRRQNISRILEAKPG